MMEIVLVGAHMTGLPLNGQITALDGRFVREAQTRDCYRLYALAGGPPQRPGLLRVAPGAAIAFGIWSILLHNIGALLAAISAPIGLGTVLLVDGATAKRFLVEAERTSGADDITHFGDWQAFLAAESPT